jgi:GNAT superfamily N-acetyltransferase
MVTRRDRRRWKIDAIASRYYSVGMKPDDVARQVAGALVSADPGVWDDLVADDVVLRIWAHDGCDAAGGRQMATQRLVRVGAWADARLEVFDVLVDGDRVAAEFRIKAESLGETLAHNWSLFATVAGQRVTRLDIYCAEPIPFDRDHDWFVSATATDDEINALFEAQRFSGDARAWVTADRRSHTSLRCRTFGSADANSQRNQVRAARWSDDEADQRIDAIIERHRADGLGFRWHVNEHDRPADLAQRLVARGFAPVLELSSMILRLDGAPAIPTSDDITIEAIDGSDPTNSEESLQVLGEAFSWDHTQIEAARAWWLPRLRGELRPYPQRFYLARIDGAPVGFGALNMSGGAADLSGAGTIPSARGRGVYTTLLARRLDDAREHGYGIVTVGTTPMSKRVVANYGFVQYGATQIYEWTPTSD